MIVTTPEAIAVIMAFLLVAIGAAFLTVVLTVYAFPGTVIHCVHRIALGALAGLLIAAFAYAMAVRFGMIAG